MILGCEHQMNIATTSILILLGAAPIAVALLGRGWRWKLQTVGLIAIDAAAFGFSQNVWTMQVVIYVAAWLCAYQC